MMHWPEWVVLIARSTGSAFVLFALSNRHITSGVPEAIPSHH
jgi:hypothetical protein